MKHLLPVFLFLSFLLPFRGLQAEGSSGEGISGKEEANMPPAQFSISPDKFILPIGAKPVNNGLRINNLQKRSVSFSVDVYNWTLDEKNQVKVIPSDRQSLDQWMAVTPLSFTLQPGQSQVIRFSVLPTVIPDPGEHRAIIFLSEQPSPEAPGEGVFHIQFRYGIGIYGWADPVRQRAVLKSLEFDPESFTLKAAIANTGNVHVRLEGNYTIWKKQLFPGSQKGGIPSGENRPKGSAAFGQIEMKPVLPGTTRTVEALIAVPREKGEYMVSIDGILGREKIRKTFSVQR